MAKKKIGRPTKYSIELITEICRRITNGEFLHRICEDKEMPSDSNVRKWRDSGEHKEFKAMYARAKEIRADKIFEEMFNIADDGTNDYVTRTTEGGYEKEVCNHEHIQRSKLRIDQRKWALARMLPKKYGDRIQQDMHIDGSGQVADSMKAITDKILKDLDDK